ncbi:DNA translocase FtsK 1-like isoform X2 [Scylla paramamosain]|uniref:DNA translocase FtsK 1-like isoform X2 n=1 Tax=Scylla paramamosain TaxID=85552 RepID=UPI00308313AE
MAHLHDHDPDNDDIERELYQLGLTDTPPPPPPALRGALPAAWPLASSARSRSAPSIQEDSFVDPPVGVHPRPPQAPLTQHGLVVTGDLGRARLGLWGGAPPPRFAVHHSLTNLSLDNPGHTNPTPACNPNPAPNPAPPTAAAAAAVALYNGALASTGGEEPPEATLPALTTAAAAAVVTAWGQDPGGVHYPGHVMPQDFNKLPRGPRGTSPHPDITDEDEERLAALVSSVEAALRRIHSGLQESYIMYENPDDEEDPPPPQPVTASLRDPPPSPVPPHEISGSPPPPASPPEPLAAGPPPGGIGVGAPRLVGPDNASRLSRELGFIPIQEGAPQPPPPPPRPAEHHKAHHHRHHLHHQHKLSKKVKNHKSKVLLSGLMSCPGPGFRLLHLRRDPASGQGFGFSIKGGREAGIGVYVSRVEQGGPAWRAGLRPGDLLLAADNTNFSSVTHAEAIALLKSAEEVTLTVATTSQLPAPVVVAQTYSWVTADGRATSPPPEYNPRLHHHQVSTVEVEVVGSESLGLMIRGGVEYSLGIFITGVDQDSAAYKAGLKVGDQILEVNGESFLAVTHDTAVNILKYSRRLQLCVRRVGRIPHSCTTYDRRSWPPSAKKDNGRSAENMEATLAMIEEKSERVLTRAAHARLREVVSDYAAGRVPIHHLLTTANELLTSPDKLSLLTELREAVRPEDQVIFDAAVFRGAARPREKTNAYGNQVSNLDDFIDFYNNRMEIQSGGGGGGGKGGGGGGGGAEEASLGLLPADHGREAAHPVRATPPSEDSGVELSNGGAMRRAGAQGRRLERKRSSKGKRENGKEGVTWADDAGKSQAIATSQEFDADDDGSEGRYEDMGGTGGGGGGGGGGEGAGDRRAASHPHRHHHHYSTAGQQAKREKILVKRYSERQLPKLHDVLGSAKQPRRHSHTGDSAALGKALAKPPGSHHHAHGQRSAHARKQYDDFERPSGSRGREDYDGLASSPSRLRDEYSRLSPRGREEYDPQGG